MGEKKTSKQIRTCISCGLKQTKGELVRFVWDGTGLKRDLEQKMAGRGAYCCNNENCEQKFHNSKKKWKRLFRL